MSEQRTKESKQERESSSDQISVADRSVQGEKDFLRQQAEVLEKKRMEMLI